MTRIKKPTKLLYKIAIVIFIVFLSLAILFADFCAYSIYVMFVKIQRIDLCKSPDGEYSLIFDEIGGSFKGDLSSVRFKLKDGFRTVNKYKTIVYQLPITHENWDVKWYDDRVEIFVLPEAASSEPNPIILYFDE